MSLYPLSWFDELYTLSWFDDAQTFPSPAKYDWAYPSRDQPIRILRNTRVVVDQLTGASIGGTQPEPQYCVVPEELLRYSLSYDKKVASAQTFQSPAKYDWAYPSRDQPICILRNTRVVVDQLTGASIGGTHPEPQYCVVPEELLRCHNIQTYLRLRGAGYRRYSCQPYNINPKTNRHGFPSPQGSKPSPGIKYMSTSSSLGKPQQRDKKLMRNAFKL
ncbi:hypothetical protein F2Q68_00001816 [Brassica cretica]|uniref:Uncharacterized protein n=1 Tax=Brassica cretica TaxID=69181 RepID=A0A8S9JPD3_BRACR|nr:hypothetical protein F2Q68_00001816 [Brassica cretica]